MIACLGGPPVIDKCEDLGEGLSVWRGKMGIPTNTVIL